MVSNYIFRWEINESIKKKKQINSWSHLYHVMFLFKINIYNQRAPSNSFRVCSHDTKWTQTGMRFHFGWKCQFGVKSTLYLYSHELRRNKTQNGMDFISAILTEMKFQTGMRFSCEHNLPETRWISAGSFGCCN